MHVCGDGITIRPIAGTRRRGATSVEDNALAEELIADPKERAEHLMLLDLGRNDVGRVAAIGSVKVTDSFFVERYSHVMHLVSNVEGKLREGLETRSDALAAGLPAGHALEVHQNPRHADHRRTRRKTCGAVCAGAVRLFRRQRRCGYLHPCCARPW